MKKHESFTVLSAFKFVVFTWDFDIQCRKRYIVRRCVLL